MSKSLSDTKIAITTGTRADWGLLLPLARELRERGTEPRIIALHAHFFEELGMTVNEIEADGFIPSCRIPTPRTPARAMAAATEGVAEWLSHNPVDALVILGDRFEMLGAASAALLARVPVVHIAGGNVTLGAYDDAIRNAISQMASLHLPETLLCARRLTEMGRPADSVVCAGSPGVWNALNTPLMTRAELAASLAFDPGDDFLLATLHAATLDSETPLRRQEDFLTALESHLEENPSRRVIITYPNTDSDPAPLIASIEAFAARLNARRPGTALAIPSLGRVRYLSAAALCRAVVGNSSSAIEETPSLGVPTLDIGVRQKGRERGPGVFCCGPSAEEIAAGLRTVCGPEARAIAARRENPYFRPGTPRLQADAIAAFLAGQPSGMQ